MAVNNSLQRHSVKHVVKLASAAVASAVVAGAAVLGSSNTSFPESINSCGMEGNATQGSWQWDANPLKNRYSMPESADIDNSVTLDGLLKGSAPTSFDASKAAEINGFIWYVKVGGTESCNCGSTSPPFMDTHIYVCAQQPVAGTSRTQLEQASIIVEVTPRLRQIMAANGVDWSTAGIDSTFTGKAVRISGWLFYDKEHEPNSQVNNPSGAHNWRGSCWELHPVTGIALAGPVDTPAGNSAAMTTGGSTVPTTTAGLGVRPASSKPPTPRRTKGTKGG